MSKPQYFYLISGLPNLSIQDAHLPFSANTFFEELRNKIDKEDFNLVCILYYPRDNHNLLNMLFSKNEKGQPEGCYSVSELKKGVDGNMVLAGYMKNFVGTFKENKNHFNEAEWEAKLTEAYFKEAIKSGNKFLKQWMEFELDFKNMLLLLLDRKQSLPFSKFIIEANGIAELLKENPLGDFSRQPSLGFYSQAIKIIETENLVEREKKIDLMRWKKLEEMTFFNYFTVEAILSFIIKLMIMERWMALKQEKGKEFLSSILNSFTEKIKIHSIEHS